MFTAFLTVTSFVVLNSAVTTQTLQATETVKANYRGAYDIMVRPAGDRERVEQDRGLLNPTFLEGHYGGIGDAQLAAIRKVDGVELAAPIAMLGTGVRSYAVSVDTGIPAGTSRPMLVTSELTWVMRNGTLRTPGGGRHELFLGTKPTTTEQALLAGEARPTLVGAHGGPEDVRVFAADGQASEAPALGSLLKDGKVHILLQTFNSFTVAAVDPVAESAMFGWDAGLTKGRVLTADDAVAKVDPGDPRAGGLTDAVPAVYVVTPPRDLKAEFRVWLQPSAVIQQYLQAAAQGTQTVSVPEAAPTATVTIDYDKVVPRLSDKRVVKAPAPSDVSGDVVTINGFSEVGSVSYEQEGDVLRAVPVEKAAGRSVGGAWWGGEGATWFRELKEPSGQQDAVNFPDLQPVGIIDPAKLPGLSSPSHLPDEFTVSTVVPRDDVARKHLGEQMRTDTNLMGYLGENPQVFIPLSSLESMSRGVRGQAISAVRVRVAGITGMDDASREKIRAVAEEIAAKTGLDVDIVIGSSLAPVHAQIPAVDGLPALDIDHMWTKKGVAVALVSQIDKKSALLSALVILSAALTMGLCASASVSARRKQLGILTCLGWRPGRLMRLIVTELAVLGLFAGVAAAVVAPLLGMALGLHVSWLAAALAVPISVALSVVAGLLSAWSAARTVPAVTVKDDVAVRKAPRGHVGSTTSFGLRQARLRPGRTLLGAVSVALPVAVIVLFGAVIADFAGKSSVNLLGRAVTVAVRKPDVIALVVLALLGAVGLAMTITLTLLEDATTFAILTALGWRPRQRAWLIVVQTLAVGVVGFVVGAALGIGLTAAMFHGLSSSTLPIVAGAGLATAAICVVLGLACSRFVSTQPTSHILTGGQ